MSRPTMDMYKELQLRKEFQEYALSQVKLNHSESWARIANITAAEIVALKRKIRKYNKPHNPKYPVAYINPTFDSVIEKYDLGEVLDEKRVNVRKFMDSIWIENPCGPYDCTGKLFSTYITYKVLHHHVIVYHWVNRDV